MSAQCFIMNVNGIASRNMTENNDAKPIPIPKEKLMSYEEKSLGTTSFFKCEVCPYMALAEDDIKFHLFTVHPDLAKTNGLADNIQIPCPGCTSVFDAEETLRNHLRQHHKMGIKDIKKMIKSLVQIALKDAKLKKEDTVDSPAPTPMRQDVADVKIPEVIEIVPDIVTTNANTLTNNVTYISMDELQHMMTPNFEKIDPKEIIQEASINILYTNDMPTQYVNVNDNPTNTHNILQVSNVTPDLISSIQPRPPVLDTNNLNLSMQPDTCDAMSHTLPPLPLQGRPYVSSYKKCSAPGKTVTRKTGERCSMPGCYAKFANKDKLVYHRKCHENGTLQCPECSSVFVSVEPLHTHLWKAHNVDMELPTCDICGYKTYKRSRLTNIHMRKHGEERPYACTICPKTFKDSNQLSKHRTLHKTEGKHKCEFCQREFAEDRRLRMHIAAVHDKLRPYKCSHCDFTCARKDEIKLHLRLHTGDKPYSCDECQFRSSDHNSMRRHKKRHSKESLYKCKQCPYTCIQSTQLTSHIISKHPDTTSNKIFKCPYCCYKSVSKDKYKSHLSSRHSDKEGIQLLIEMIKSPVSTSNRSWTIPSQELAQEVRPNKIETDNDSQANAEAIKNVNNIPIDVDDCDSQQEGMSQNYPKNYCKNVVNDDQQTNYNEQDVVTDLSKEDNNSDCLISESSNDTMIERHQYSSQIQLQNINYDNTQYLNSSVAIGQGLLQCTNVNALTSNSPSLSTISNNIMGNFPIRLPQISVRNNITLKAIDKIPFPVNKVTGPIIKPTQILPVPSSSNSPVNIVQEPEGVPRKKPKISVKSNLILKGPDQGNMFHSQQKMAFRRLEDNERFGLGSPVTFNNLITTQFMQLPPEPVLSESPNNLMPYSQETILNSASTPLDTRINDNSQMFTFNTPPLNVNAMSMLPPPQKIQTVDPSYIKIEATIKQNTQSPSLEKMCTANAISREYKASPPLEDINKNMSEIKNEVKSDAFYNIALNNTSHNAHIMDQYLMDNIIGEQYAGHLDLSNIVLTEPLSNIDDQQNDVIEIDDNSDDTKLLPRFDMNFPLESLYLMNNDFHFLDNDLPAQCPNTLPTEVTVNEMTRIVNEVPIVNQNKTNLNLGTPGENTNSEFANFIHGKKDPMMVTSVKVNTNKINVKNIELMKN